MLQINTTETIGLFTMTDEKYFSLDILSRSELLLLQKSVRGFKNRRGNKPKKESPQLKFGNFFDTLITNRREFKKLYTLPFEYPKFNKRTKAGKAEYEKWLEDNKELIEEHEQKIEMKEVDYNLAYKMEQELFENPETARFFLEEKWDEFYYQLVAIAPMKIAGKEELIRVKPDVVMVKGDQIFIVDLKTISRLDSIEYNVKTFKYYFQQWLYTKIFSAATGIPEENIHFSFVFVEKEYPYESQHVTLSSEWDIISRRLFNTLEDNFIKATTGRDENIYQKRLHLEVPNYLK